MASCKDHICTVDYLDKQLIRLSGLDRFLSIYYVSLKAYRKSMGYKNTKSKSKILKDFLKTGRAFVYCPLCGSKIHYKDLF